MLRRNQADMPLGRARGAIEVLGHCELLNGFGIKRLAYPLPDGGVLERRRADRRDVTSAHVPGRRWSMLGLRRFTPHLC